MSNNNCVCQHKATTSDPATKNYADKAKNKANEKSPFCSDEPSPHTNYK